MIKNYKNLELKFSPEEGFSLFGQDLQTSEYVKIIHAPVSLYEPATNILLFKVTREFCEDIVELINEKLNETIQKDGSYENMRRIFYIQTNEDISHEEVKEWFDANKKLFMKNQYNQNGEHHEIK